MNKIKVLLEQEQKTFHASDLALLWDIQNKSTLNMTLKRLVDRGILKRIHKGFYATKKIENLDPLDLGFACLNTFSYVSTETILSQKGVIFQDIKYITFISSRSKTFQIGKTSYKARQMKDKFLNNTLGIRKVGNHFEADLERAIADLLYYNPKYYFDNTKQIDFEKVKNYQKEIGYVTS